MTPQEEIQAKDAEIMTQRHYSKYGTDPQWTRDQLVRAGDAAAMHDVDTVDTILLRARQPNAQPCVGNQPIKSYRPRGAELTVVIAIAAFFLGVWL